MALDLRDNGSGTFAVSLSAAASTTVTPSEGAGTGSAYDAPAIVAPAAGGAAGAGTAYDGAVKVTVSPGAAVGTGTANDPSASSTSLYAGGSAGNNTAPTVTFPAGITPGMAILVMLMQNNTDVVTDVPAELFTLDPITPATGTGAANLYVMIADGSTASSTLTWTLSATRNWTTTWIALSDVVQDLAFTVNVLESAASTVTATNTFTMPSADSTDDGYVIEFFGAKADGVALTDLSPPAGYTERFQRLSSTGTFGSNTAVATRDGNPAAPGTYGGDSWTTSSNLTTTFRYTVVLRQSEPLLPGVGLGEAGDATIAIIVYPAEAQGTGTAHFDTAGTEASLTLIGDNPIYGFGTAYDATVSTAVTATATPTEAAGTGAAYDGAVRITVSPDAATGTGAALDAVPAVAATAAAATGTGTASNPAPATLTAAGSSSGAGSAFDATVSVTVYPDAATGVGASDDGYVIQAGTAPGGLASGAGTAYDATTTLLTVVGPADGSGAAYDPLVAVTTAPAVLTGTGAAYDGAVRITVSPDAAVGVGVAYQLTPNPGSRGSVHGHGRPRRPTVGRGWRGPVVGSGTRPAVAASTATADILILSDASGNVASGTVATVTLPTVPAGGYVLLIVNRNQTSTPFTFDANVLDAVELAQAGTRRLTALRVTPNGAPASFAVTASVSGVWTWWCAVLSGVHPTAPVAAVANGIGNSTTATIDVPSLTLGYAATGHEAVLSAGGVNATATWATSGATVFNTTANSAALMVNRLTPAAGDLSVLAPAMDRGNEGVSRNESVLALALQPALVLPPSRLVDGGTRGGPTVGGGRRVASTVGGV